MANNPNHIRFNDSQPHKAKIFLSCGQATQEERNFAKKLKEELQKKDFNVFVAIDENTIKELDKELLIHLKTSDYFLCVNLKRELVVDYCIGKKCFYRGSLYTNQEIAMATAVGFSSENMLIFSQKDIPRDGLLKSIITNDCEFEDVNALCDKILEKIKKEEWSAAYCRAIQLLNVKFNNQVTPWKETSKYTKNKRIDWVAKLEIKNCRRDTVATNCMLHLKQISKDGKEIENNEPYPLKCCYVEGFSHTLFPNETAYFDLLAVEENTTDVFLRSTKDYRPNQIKEPVFSGKGIYTLEFELFADMFPIKTFLVDLAVGMDFPEKAKV